MLVFGFCWFDGDFFSFCGKLDFIVILIDVGMCYIFNVNFGEVKYIIIVGVGGGLYFLLDV